MAICSSAPPTSVRFPNHGVVVISTGVPAGHGAEKSLAFAASTSIAQEISRLRPLRGLRAKRQHVLVAGTGRWRHRRLPTHGGTGPPVLGWYEARCLRHATKRADPG